MTDIDETIDADANQLQPTIVHIAARLLLLECVELARPREDDAMR